MLISKFDLYKTEWLDLVFQDRNKEYGAYYLRQHYASNMVKAMGITFSGVALLFGLSVVLKARPVVVPIKPDMTLVTIDPTIKPPVTPPKKAAQPVKPIEPPAPVKMTQHIPPVVAPDAIAVNPPKNSDLTGPTGSVTTPGKDDQAINIIPADPPGTGPAGPAPDNSVHNMIGLESMPEPIGGEAAWSKFLNKNLRYPNEAQDAGASGRVFISFVIEKDGHLSNITLEKGAGHGFDEEALRVLKLAKAWKPGVQNNQPVRVKYTIPINFQAAE